MRAPKPIELIQWEEWVKAGPPQFCHNCDEYSGDGYCFIFKMKVPDDFATSRGACSNWKQELPF